MKTAERNARLIPQAVEFSGHTSKRELASPAFTLIEILVAMAIFALVLVAIYSTWTLILRGSRSGLDAAAQIQRERLAVHTIEQALSSVRSFAADLGHYSFDVQNGGAATLSFGARLPDSFPRSGKYGDFNVRRVMFSVENTGEGERSLVLRQWPILMEMDEDEQLHPLVLARNVKDFVVETWDNQAGDWSDVWEQTNSIPPIVKVTLSFNAPARGYSSSSSQAREQISRVMALPSVTVPAMWQIPTAQGGQNSSIRNNRNNQNQNQNQNNPNNQNNQNIRQNQQGGKGNIRLQ